MNASDETAPVSLNWNEASRFSEASDSPGFLLWKAAITWRRSVEAALKPIGLTHPQFVVLAGVGWLGSQGRPISQTAVGRHVGMDANTLSSIMRALESRGLLARAHVQDERAKHADLTPAGAACLKTALVAVENADAAFFGVRMMPATMDALRTLASEP